MKTISLSADVPANREVHIKLPDDVPVGPAEIVVVVAPRAETPARTLGDLLQSEFFGAWAGRADMQDGVEEARRLRIEAWKRS